MKHTIPRDEAILRNKLSGFGAVLLWIVISFVLFKVIFHHEFHIENIMYGIYFVVIYSIPFIFIGACTVWLVKNFFRRIPLHLFRLIYLGIGLLISIAVNIVFEFYKSIDMFLYVVITCSIGALTFKGGSEIRNSIGVIFFSLVVPVALILFIVFI